MRYKNLYDDCIFDINCSRDEKKHIYIKSIDMMDDEMFLWIGYKGLLAEYREFKVLGTDRGCDVYAFL